LRVRAKKEAGISYLERGQRPTIHDVARQAGVSSTTVSHVLNETRFVADETRARVLSAVDSLGYDPNGAARSLRSRRRRIVGLLITNPHNRGFASFMDGLDEVFAPAGFSVIVSTTRGDPDRELAALRMIGEQRVDGLILASWTGAKEDHLHRLHASGLPMVRLNRLTGTLPVDLVALDYAAAGRLMATHLLGLGHRRFAHLGIGSSHEANRANPFAIAWHEALAELGLGPEATQTYPGVSREEIGYRLTKEVLEGKDRPSAIVAGNMPLVLGALLACQELSVAIPRDLSLATLGDAYWTRLTAPPITAIPDALPEWGRLAGRFLLERILGQYDGPPRTELFLPELIVRGSTGRDGENFHHRGTE
jgi:LacI family transcriptional regulator